MKRMLNICSCERLELLERNTIRAEGREGFVQTPIAAGTFVRRGNPVTAVLQSNGVEHK
jgi:hypothetical protein